MVNQGKKFKAAYDAFVASDEHKECSNPSTLGAANTQRQYLENRLWRAFSAGWDAALAADEQVAPNKARG